jgi:hypothetical protein
MPHFLPKSGHQRGKNPQHNARGCLLALFFVQLLSEPRQGRVFLSLEFDGKILTAGDDFS